MLSIFDRPLTPATPTLVISLGCLQKLQQSATVQAFLNLAHKKNSQLKINPTQLDSMLPILKYIDEFKLGNISATEFRTELVNRIMQDPVNISPDEFDEAFNAMLGNTKELEENIESILAYCQIAKINVVFTSETNEIHANQLQIDKLRKKYNLDIVTSHEQKCLGIRFYQKVCSDLKDNSVTLVFDQNINVPSIAAYQKNEYATAIKDWANQRNFEIISLPVLRDRMETFLALPKMCSMK